MFKYLAKVKEISLDILFPPVCAICNKNLDKSGENRTACDKCFALIPILNTLSCPKCKARLANNTKTCHQNIPYRLMAASAYNNEQIRNIVWKLKYEKRTFAAKTIAEIMTAHIELLNFNLKNYHIVPIPLHKSKERKRGFNQTFLIAKNLSINLGLPIISRVLRRIKNTKAQADTRNFEERKKNMENSFDIKNLFLIEKKNILLIDDVFTSGATINEAVRVLKKSGANKIIALVAARAG